MSIRRPVGQAVQVTDNNSNQKFPWIFPEGDTDGHLKGLILTKIMQRMKISFTEGQPKSSQATSSATLRPSI